MKKEIITITGKPGSGKSTTANILAAKLGYDRYSAGTFIRQIAQQRGISNEEANRQAVNDPSIDREMDALTEAIGKERDRMVIDGRLTFHFIPESFKVYLDLDTRVAAERIFASNDESRRQSGDAAASVEATLLGLEGRLAAEQARYQNLYGINPHDTTHFDLVINTSHIGPEEVARQILEAYETWRTA
jgi:CMP/dCMP kinase